MAPHIVSSFDAELQKLSAKVIDMGALVSSQIDLAAEALRNADSALARRVIFNDSAVDAMQIKIEELVVATIAKRAPLAVDLRETIAILKIAIDLERMGDLAKNNAKRIVALSGQKRPVAAGVNIEALNSRIFMQLSLVMQAFSQRDAEKARNVWMSDGEVDSLHNALFRELLTYMMEDPRSIGYCTHLLFCAKNLERIGDHATNIAEHIYFIASGTFLSGGRPKADDPQPLTSSEE